MPLGWDSNTKYTVESTKLEGGKAKLGVGNPWAPHLLYETLHYQDSRQLLPGARQM